MTAADASGLRRGILVPSVATVAALAILVGLGVWQLERMAWKDGLVAELTERLAAPPVALPPARDWPRLAPAADEFLRVTATVQFLDDKEGLVYTSGSSLRDDVGGPGYWVFTPARLPDGGLVMVNRGFVPEDKRSAASRPEGEIAGPVAVVGVLRWPEPPGLFTPAGDAARNLWFSRDSAAIAAAKGIDAAPFYIELESPLPPGGLPRAGRLKPVLPNNHFQYALTWLGLAGVLVCVYAVWLWGNWRPAVPGEPPSYADRLTSRTHGGAPAPPASRR
jgi:surfeit locus 1 family protein